MYQHQLHQQINQCVKEKELPEGDAGILFLTRFIANAATIKALYDEIYEHHPKAKESFDRLLNVITTAFADRPESMKDKDDEKQDQGYWFLSNHITGMSLYVDRFCGSLSNMESKLDYLKGLGVNLLHLMPVFASPPGESDGGYAVSDYRTVDPRFGTLEDLKKLRQEMGTRQMFLMVDIVLNHTSHRHEWAQKAKQGDENYQAYFHMYPDREMPDRFERSMPEIFPESSPGNFAYCQEINKWVMTIFHNYQWDLNYTNPAVLLDMLEIIFFYGNLGVDVLRIDAPAFIWKQVGTNCQNLPQTHTLLRLIKQCVQTAMPGMAILGEAIVAPKEILKYFGTGLFTARECDLAYGATNMALQWDALATADTRVMLAAQHDILQKPYGTSWITYTRCHDDIGLGYDNQMIQHAGFAPFPHRKFIMDYYSGAYPGSPASGALFSVNPKTGDARISGSLASLCGLEKALLSKDSAAIDLAISRILMMQAHSFLLGGIPMIFYGDEAGHTNDYSYLDDPGKAYDNRWMHRPVIDWERNKRVAEQGTTEERVYSATRRLIAIRNQLPMIADAKNLTWLPPHNLHVAGYLRTLENRRLYCLFNFSDRQQGITWYVFKEHGENPGRLFDHWNEQEHSVGLDHEFLTLAPYQFMVLEPVEAEP
ncbi:MAG TPA: alpha-amylase family glycosyl hydrolase [Terrimicrobium sp.]